MRKHMLTGALSGTISFSLASAAFAQDDSATMERYTRALGPTAQINTVAELADVDPNQWAFQALKSLIERYGCIEGEPSKQYLGNRVLTRYEFAAGLNACLERIGEQIAAATNPLATKEDLAAVQRLQEEFKVELTALRGRVDASEAKTKELEARQFSTTTKLDGSVVMAAQGGSAGGNVQTSSASALGIPTGIASGSAANTTFAGRTNLNLRASFTGKDELLIRMRAVTGQDISGTFPGVASNRGTLRYAGGAAGSFDGSTPGLAPNGNATVSFDKIRYTTPLFSDNFRVFIGPRIELREIIDTSSFASNEEEDFSSGFFNNNPLIVHGIGAGPGAGFDWKIGEQFSLRAAYIAGDGGRSNGSGQGGLTGSDTVGSAEFEFRPSQQAKIKLQYSGYTNNTFPSPLGITGTQKTDAFGLNAEWAITPNIAIFGRYGTGTTKNYNTGFVGLTAVPAGDYTLSTWQLGLAFPDVFGPGNSLGIAVGQPNKVTSGPITASGTETNYELYSNIRLNDRITLTPDVQFISQPNNIAGNPSITVGTLRLVFTF
jgi:hypothetical protein